MLYVIRYTIVKHIDVKHIDTIVKYVIDYTCNQLMYNVIYT